MAKKKETKVVKEQPIIKEKIQPILDTFSNGEVNVLKDKLNEIIEQL